MLKAANFFSGNVVKNGWWFLIKKELNRRCKLEEETGSAGVQLVSNTIYVTKAKAGSKFPAFFIGCVTRWLRKLIARYS